MADGTRPGATDRPAGTRAVVRRWRRGARIAAIATAGTLLAAAAFLWGVAMPVRDLPAPTGSYPVGTVTYDLTDPARRERYRLPESDAPTRRTIRLQLWYPAGESASADAPRDPWMPDGPAHTRAIVRTHGFPFFIWEHTRWMRSNSHRAVPIAAAGAGGAPARLPVAIIVHGWEGYRGLHADIAEDLASHGYLVAAADHSYGAAAVRLADGRILRSRPDVLPERGTTDAFSRRAATLVATFAEDVATIRRHLDDLAAGRTPAGVTAAARDRTVLAGLAGRIAADRTALIGHSTGGGAVVRAVLEDPDAAAGVTALVGLDAWVEPIGAERLAREDLPVPTLFLRSEEWIGGINDAFLVPFVDRLESAGLPVELRQMEGITHEQFSTLYMYAPVTRWVGLLGSADPRQFAEQQRRIIRGFVLRNR